MPEKILQEPLLLVGNTVRYLAESAQPSGIEVTGVDAFGDSDMQAACRRYRRAAAPGARGLATAVQDGAPGVGVEWTFAAGFEAAPEVLMQLYRRRRRLLGNHPGVLQLLAQPPRFFRLLSALGIAHPRVLNARPQRREGWLFKTAGSFGGEGVAQAGDAGHLCAPGYHQQFIRGPLCSLLFVADGRVCRVLGFNRLSARYPAAGDFRFASAISGLVPTVSQQDVMVRAAQRLTRALGLRGVNGLDFVLHAGEPLLLELNARPPATLELYEPVLPQGGLACHIAACRGRLPSAVEPPPTRGVRVVYARRHACIRASDWPDWVSDRPAVGEEVPSDSPLCTVHADGCDLDAVAARLRERVDIVHGLVHRWSEEAA